MSIGGGELFTANAWNLINHAEKHTKQELIIVGTTMSFSFYTHFRGIFFEQIQSNMPNDGEIFAAVIFSHAAIIFIKGNV